MWLWTTGRECMSPRCTDRWELRLENTCKKGRKENCKR